MGPTKAIAVLTERQAFLLERVERGYYGTNSTHWARAEAAALGVAIRVLEEKRLANQEKHTPDLTG